jgi:hypothetical protein
MKNRTTSSGARWGRTFSSAILDFLLPMATSPLMKGCWRIAWTRSEMRLPSFGQLTAVRIIKKASSTR